MNVPLTDAQLPQGWGGDAPHLSEDGWIAVLPGDPHDHGDYFEGLFPDGSGETEEGIWEAQPGVEVQEGEGNIGLQGVPAGGGYTATETRSGFTSETVSAKVEARCSVPLDAQLGDVGARVTPRPPRPKRHGAQRSPRVALAPARARPNLAAAAACDTPSGWSMLNPFAWGEVMGCALVGFLWELLDLLKDLLLPSFSIQDKIAEFIDSTQDRDHAARRGPW